MSATRDQNQKFGFHYNNLYVLYKKEAARTPQAEQVATTTPATTPTANPAAPMGHERSSGVLKAGDAHSAQIRAYQPVEFLAKRAEAQEIKSSLQNSGQTKLESRFGRPSVGRS